MKCPEVDWHLLDIKRKEEHIDLVGVFNDHITEVYKNYTQIYTDGTKNPETGITGIGVVVPAWGIEVNRRASNNLAVYTVELNSFHNWRTLHRLWTELNELSLTEQYFWQLH